MARRGQCCSRTELLKEVWQMVPDAGTNVVDVYVNYLRKKLTPSSGDAGDPVIETVRGVRVRDRRGGLEEAGAVGGIIRAGDTHGRPSGCLMAGAAGVSEGEGTMLAQIAHSLHEMCQPLTVLQCRLEIDLMEADLEPGVKQTAAGCLRECERLNDRVSTMRALLQQALKEERRGRS